ncbi:MAG: hypothetical protein GTO13_12260 [Proteobacteria bacterium]|nr:hypothetical protein [Pseudomonadota bacterium]
MRSLCWKHSLLALLALTLATCDSGNSSRSAPTLPGGGAVAPQVDTLNPTPNNPDVPVGADINATFDQTMNAANGSTFPVEGFLSSKLTGTYRGAGTDTLTFDPGSDFKPGEEVEVTLTTGLTSTGGASLDAPFVYRFRAAVAGGNATFVSIGTPLVDGNPSSITSSDLDGDGDVDLAVANSSTLDVSVLLNELDEPSGAFVGALGSPFSVDGEPSAITSGDLDGDGDSDLAVANASTLNVTVLLNELDEPSGVFSEASGSPVGVDGIPSSITSGDLDGDGDLDLAVANASTLDVTVLLNNGAGTFSGVSGSPFSVDGEPSSITSGDLDGDGDLDLAVANASTLDVTVLLNNGSASFSGASGSPFNVDGIPSSITLGDLDGDGDLDLAVANASTLDVTILLNDGSSDFVSALGSPFNVAGEPSSITSGDLDGDGDLDLAAANASTLDVTVLLNDGSADFVAGGSFNVAGEPSSITSADLDGDGNLDLAVANASTLDVSVLSNGP